MESYLMMLYVTLEQESALKNFFVDQGWRFCKPDLSVTTDKVGPSVTTPPVVPLKDKAAADDTVADQNKQSSRIVVKEPESTPKTDSPLTRNKGKRKTESPQATSTNVKQPKVLLPQSTVTVPKSSESVSSKTEVVDKPLSSSSNLTPITVLGEDGKHFTIKIEQDADDLQENVVQAESRHDGICANSSDNVMCNDNNSFYDGGDDNFHDDGDDVNDESTDMDYSNDGALGNTSVNTENQLSAGDSMGSASLKGSTKSKGKVHYSSALMQCTSVSGQRIFKSVSSEDIENFIDLSHQNKNTLRKTTGDTSLFKSFCETKEEFRSLEMIPPYQLNQLLCEFILSVTKKNGTEYEPTSLRCIIGSIHRYLRLNDYHWSIITSAEFKRAREVLKTKQKQLKMLGKGGCKTKAADQVDDDLIEKFYECGILGDGNPKALINTLWVMVTVHFGIRTGQEAYNMRWGDVQVKEDSFGEYLLYDAEKQCKTKTDSRLCQARVYSMNDPPRDPVHLYKLYLDKRPPGMLEDNSPFFLSVANSAPNLLQSWFKTQPMGINKLYNILRDMRLEADMINEQRAAADRL
ncbi:uncharacterized protein KIAA1958 homolog isoform X3 [Ruditapes philippinarum]|uniref:uncharacterized protein KIAA1958 homolog isoform X3 n=1 Tax=Ruditapes philippinarum TaxID=129788 RepID=UPI00295ABDF3|nr:uncharacterized protein KIAA1958 homolog isoform X3 [Ruditapes philippinarum]